LIPSFRIAVEFSSTAINKLMTLDPIKRQSLIHLITNISITAIGFLSTVYFARVLGPSILGAYYLFFAYFSIFNLIVDGGFGNATAKRISEGKEQEEFFSASAALRLALLLITVGLLFAFRPFLVDLDSAGLFWWLILALVVNLFFGIPYGGNYGLGKAGIVQISNLLNNLSRIVLQVLAVFFGFQLAGLAGGFVCGLIIGALVNYRYLELQFRRFNWSHLKSLFTFSFWIFLAMSGVLVFTTADVVLIGYFMSNAEVGIYRVAINLATLGVFVALALQYVLYPKFSRWNEEGNHELMTSSLARAYTYSLILALPFCVGGWLLGDKLLFYLFGEAFSTGTGALFILLSVYVIYVFLYLQMMTLNALNHPKDSFRVTAVAVVVNIALNVLLIPVLGIIGAALATLVSIALNAIFGYVVLRKYISVTVEKKPVFHILVAVVAMALVVGGIRLVVPVTNLWYLVGMVIIGAVVYFFTLLKTDRNIRDELKELVMQMGVFWPDWI
jgi:O-antigen/teichoic acid export membrane protein